MSITKYLIICWLGVASFAVTGASAGDWTGFGPLYDRFPLTLEPGVRSEWVGPLFSSQTKESERQWAFPPLGMSRTWDRELDYEEYDFLYPVLTYDRFGKEDRWQFFQLLSFAGGQTQEETENHRFTIFPFYFQQRSTDPTNDYTALFPIYGQLKNRLFRDEIDFALFPLYAKTRKKDVVTYNVPYPFVHFRHGDGLSGWQVWPLTGHEHKDVTMATNGFGDAVTNGGHETRFVLWPFFTDAKTGIGTENPVKQQALIPVYSLYRSPLRDSTSYFWPLGATHSVDREKKYTEWDAPWPLIEFARGEGKTTSRVWPFFSQAHNQYVEDDWYLWPVFKYNGINAPPLERKRSRVLFFLYSDLNEKNTETGAALHRTDLLPLFTHRRDFNGSERLQILSILEPFFPNNKGIERNYSPLYALWRSEKNPKTGAASQSLLWNLYRRDVTPGTKKISLLFGLFQYQSGPEGARGRVCYIPVGKKPKPAPGPQPGH